ncbi:MAG: hypothetical protein OXI43_16555 [Candidatus Poribacteria bacterium]|nr:hypothetical protein [Candidatus Poribacteria bacterium]
MTTEQATDLQNTLEDMMNRITKGDDITEQLLRIEQLSVDIELTAPKMLKHYLEKKSYTKALDFLKDQDLRSPP